MLSHPDAGTPLLLRTMTNRDYLVIICRQNCNIPVLFYFFQVTLLKNWKMRMNKAGVKAEKMEKLAFIPQTTLKLYNLKPSGFSGQNSNRIPSEFHQNSWRILAVCAAIIPVTIKKHELTKRRVMNTMHSNPTYYYEKVKINLELDLNRNKVFEFWNIMFLWVFFEELSC